MEEQYIAGLTALHNRALAVDSLREEYGRLSKGMELMET